MGRMVDRRASIAANTKIDNVLSGKTEEFVTRPSLVRVLASAAAAGVKATVLAGGVNMCDDQEISKANRFPILPDDVLVEFGAGAGGTDRLVISQRNDTGAAIADVYTVVDVIPL